MATAHTPHPISGSIGDVTYSRRNGKTIVRMKRGITREKFLTHPRLQLSRENAQTFGGASKIACAIYSSLVSRNSKILAPYSHNKLITKLLKGMRRKCHFVEDIRFTDIAHLLRDIDLSPTIEVSKRLQATTLGPNHCPETLILNGIHQAASLAQGRSRNRIEFRIELKYIEIPEVTHRNQKKWTFLKGQDKYVIATSNPTNWIPVEILPQEPLKLSLHHAAGKQIPKPIQHPINPRIQIQEAQHPNDFHLSSFILHQTQQPNKAPSSPTAVFLLIEWREVNEETNEVTLLKDKTITKLVALQMDQATAEQLAHLPPLPKPILDEYHEPTPPQWRQSPADYLAQSLANLQAPPPS